MGVRRYDDPEYALIERRLISGKTSVQIVGRVRLRLPLKRSWRTVGAIQALLHLFSEPVDRFGECIITVLLCSKVMSSIGVFDEVM